MSVGDELSALLFVTRPHHALHVPAEALDPGGGEDGFWGTADSDVEIDPAFRIGWSHGGGDVAVADHAQRSADAADFGHDLGVTRAIEHHHDDVLHAFVQRFRHRDECLLD